MNALARAEQELARGGSVNEVALRLGLRRDQVEGVAAVMRQRAAAAVAGARDNGGAARRLTAPDAKPAAAVRQAGSGDLVEGQLMRVGRIPNRVLEVWRQAQGGSDG